jgi:hypothetical protein
VFPSTVALSTVHSGKREGRLSQRTVLWLIPTFLTVHNAEEAVAFARMQPHLGFALPEPFATLQARLTYPAFLQALAILSVLAFILALIVTLRPRAQGAPWLLLALEAAVAINVIAHVLTAVVLFHGYGPGLGTAVLLNAPFAVYTLGRAKREAWVSARAWRALLGAGLVLHGPALIGLLFFVTR